MPPYDKLVQPSLLPKGQVPEVRLQGLPLRLIGLTHFHLSIVIKRLSDVAGLEKEGAL